MLPDRRRSQPKPIPPIVVATTSPSTTAGAAAPRGHRRRRRSPRCARRVQRRADVPEPERERADEQRARGGRRRAARSPGSRRGTPAPRRARWRAGCGRAAGPRPPPADASVTRSSWKRGAASGRGRGRPAVAATIAPAATAPTAQAATRGRGGRTRWSRASTPAPRASAASPTAAPRRRRGRTRSGMNRCDDRPPRQRHRRRHQIRPEPQLVSGRITVARATDSRPETGHGRAGGLVGGPEALGVGAHARGGARRGRCRSRRGRRRRCRTSPAGGRRGTRPSRPRAAGGHRLAGDVVDALDHREVVGHELVEADVDRLPVGDQVAVALARRGAGPRPAATSTARTPCGSGWATLIRAAYVSIVHDRRGDRDRVAVGHDERRVGEHVEQRAGSARSAAATSAPSARRRAATSAPAARVFRYS